MRFTMLNKYCIWDKTSNVYTPSGNMYTAEEWINKYKWTNIPGMVPVMSAGNINGAMIADLASMKKNAIAQGCTFTDGMTDEQVLEAIEAWENQKSEEAKAAAQEAANTPTTEERIAAAMEYANLLNS